MIKIQNFSFSYIDAKEKALSKINLEVQDGEFLGIIGSSGAGKTTLSYAINGIIPHHYKGCGTGDFLIEIAEKANKESLLQGIDISEEMMKIGREKIKKNGFTAKLEQADCEALPFDNDTFDRISVGFGVRNFEHLSLGIKEMCRVLKPNGKLVILELSVPTNPFIRWCYKLYFLKILPAIGGWVSGDKGAYKYLPASVLKFPAPPVFIDIMKEAGFKTVIHKPLTLGICRMYIGLKI